jgi:hypothetical protein
VSTGGLIEKLLQRFKHPEHGYRSSPEHDHVRGAGYYQ